MNARLRVTVAAACLALACSNSTQPGVQTQDPTFLEWAETAPALEEYQREFFGVAGIQQEWEINYVGGDRFLRLRLDAETLVRDSAGNPLAPGDSVRITITVDSTRFIMKFQPEGLLFNPDRPADLNIVYNHADPVFLSQESEIRPWRQEREGDPWEELLWTLWDTELDEIEVDVFGFTRYALAVN